jgi:hypothetical protein
MWGIPLRALARRGLLAAPLLQRLPSSYFHPLASAWVRGLAASAAAPSTLDAHTHNNEAHGPLAIYDTLRHAGKIQRDDHQREVVVKLQTLCAQLKGHASNIEPDAAPSQSFLGRLFGLSSAPAPRTSSSTQIRGLYLHGDVGAGKTMLMDLFCEAAQPASKRRVHFNEFMLDVHARIHAWKQNRDRTATDYDPIPPVARAIAQEAALLCFDEFQARLVCVWVCRGEVGRCVCGGGRCFGGCAWVDGDCLLICPISSPDDLLERHTVCVLTGTGHGRC